MSATTPATPATTDRAATPRRNILASDLGLIAKRGNDGSLLIACSDLRTADADGRREASMYWTCSARAWRQARHRRRRAGHRALHQAQALPARREQGPPTRLPQAGRR